MTTHTHAITQAIDLLQQANNVVALTGAGISTPSGIPDFRSHDSGIWHRVDPMAVASIYAFKHNPQAFFDWIHPLAKKIINAEPNAAHLALAQLEAAGLLTAVITQNIDLLHSKAGSQTIYEVHGHLREATCMGCHEVYNGEVILKDFVANGSVPICPGCGQTIKPNIILYGEMLPLPVLQRAQKAAQLCDVMIVAGSSLEVSPAGDLPLLAKQSGAALIFVNLTETHLDDIADVVVHNDVVEILPRLAAPFRGAETK